jgi:hypothetical protein
MGFWAWIRFPELMDPDPVELIIGSGCICGSEINTLAVSKENL